LLANGHPDAWEYPLGMVWDEARIVVDRDNGMEATRAVLLQLAVSSVLSKEGGKAFREQIEKLTE
jgi:hypothetical protein